MRLLRLSSLATNCAIITLGVVVSAASAGRLSSSSTTIRATWARYDYTGGFGTVECEVTLEGSMHARTMTKTAGALSGFITAASVSSPCRRGSSTILSETLPWHVTYKGFSGTLPNITSVVTDITGGGFRIREPTFGIGCLTRTTAERPSTGTFNLGAGGIVTSITVSGTIPCGEFTGRLSGTTEGDRARDRERARELGVTSAGGARLTITLI